MPEATARERRESLVAWGADGRIRYTRRAHSTSVAARRPRKTAADVTAGRYRDRLAATPPTAIASHISQDTTTVPSGPMPSPTPPTPKQSSIRSLPWRHLDAVLPISWTDSDVSLRRRLLHSHASSTPVAATSDAPTIQRVSPWAMLESQEQSERRASRFRSGLLTPPAARPSRFSDDGSRCLHELQRLASSRHPVDRDAMNRLFAMEMSPAQYTVRHFLLKTLESNESLVAAGSEGDMGNLREQLGNVAPSSSAALGAAVTEDGNFSPTRLFHALMAEGGASNTEPLSNSAAEPASLNNDPPVDEVSGSGTEGTAAAVERLTDIMHAVRDSVDKRSASATQAPQELSPPPADAEGNNSEHDHAVSHKAEHDHVKVDDVASDVSVDEATLDLERVSIANNNNNSDDQYAPCRRLRALASKYFTARLAHADKISDARQESWRATNISPDASAFSKLTFHKIRAQIEIADRVAERLGLPRPQRLDLPSVTS